MNTPACSIEFSAAEILEQRHGLSPWKLWSPSSNDPYAEWHFKKKTVPKFSCYAPTMCRQLNWHRTCFSASGGKHQLCDSESYLSFLSLKNENGQIITPTSKSRGVVKCSYV